MQAVCLRQRRSYSIYVGSSKPTGICSTRSSCGISELPSMSLGTGYTRLIPCWGPDQIILVWVPRDSAWCSSSVRAIETLARGSEAPEDKTISPTENSKWIPMLTRKRRERRLRSSLTASILRPTRIRLGVVFALNHSQFKSTSRCSGTNFFSNQRN